MAVGVDTAAAEVDDFDGLVARVGGGGGAAAGFRSRFACVRVSDVWV